MKRFRFKERNEYFFELRQLKARKPYHKQETQYLRNIVFKVYCKEGERKIPLIHINDYWIALAKEDITFSQLEYISSNQPFYYKK